MLAKAFHLDTKDNRFIRLVLVFALVFAAFHVALHDLDLRGEGGEQCQVCSLNNVPVVSFAIPSLHAPLNILAFVLPVTDVDYQSSYPFHIQWARAPPPF